MVPQICLQVLAFHVQFARNLLASIRVVAFARVSRVSPQTGSGGGTVGQPDGVDAAAGIAG
ncbi:hypothetical protein A5634_01950 [Mycobacterium asiaticum]|uniref:Uncharacterized protein n=1 Tax=Mycobacterium asiaticum TaxID=1790 RepID=A0A1A3NTB7_MYCAS|nr:hypothetical protein A5634_01950 [Mycobacterium asiaticum]